MYCIGLQFVIYSYGTFFRGNNPMLPLGTLSLLCEDRKIWFWLWGVLVSGGIVMNAQYMYRKYGHKNRLLDVLCGLSFIGMCCIALTLGHSIDDWNPKRILHWVATGVFIALTFASIALFFIIYRKLHKGFGVLIICICYFIDLYCYFCCCRQKCSYGNGSSGTASDSAVCS